MTETSPNLIMVAGPNGSGKTTLIRTLRAAHDIALPDYYINADDLRQENGIDSRAAQKLAESRRLEAIAQRRSFIYETVMSHPSKIAELQAATLAGFSITVVFIATGDPSVNIKRVALRVADGGHDVPRDKIRARHRRSIGLAPSAIAFAMHAYVYDNTAWGTEDTQQLQAALNRAMLQPVVANPAPWVAELIETVNERVGELEDIYRSAKDHVGIAVPNLFGSVSEGPVAVSEKHYVLQMDKESGRALVHDKALLSKPVVRSHSYRIEYAQGVSKVTRRASGRIRAVKQTRK